MRRRPSFLLILALLAAALAGCGGDTVEADEVPGAPPVINLPKGGGEVAQNSSEDDEDDSDEDSDDEDGTPTPTATPSGGGGAAATPAPQATATAQPTATPDPGGTGGTEAQFDDFCQQNPGAC